MVRTRTCPDRGSEPGPDPVPDSQSAGSDYTGEAYVMWVSKVHGKLCEAVIS